MPIPRRQTPNPLSVAAASPPPPPIPERIISPRQMSRTQSSDAVFLFALSEVCVCIAYLSRGSAPSRCLLLSGAAHARPEPIGSVPLPLFPIHRGSPTSRSQLQIPDTCLPHSPSIGSSTYWPPEPSLGEHSTSARTPPPPPHPPSHPSLPSSQRRKLTHAEPPPRPTPVVGPARLPQPARAACRAAPLHHSCMPAQATREHRNGSSLHAALWAA